jgi:hypothetical protein
MNCPLCKNETRVVDSRASINNTIRRTRACTVCNFRYNTLEILIPDRITTQTFLDAIRPDTTGAVSKLTKIKAILEEKDIPA